MGDYRSLRVWEQAHKLALAVYMITRSFPRAETYGLMGQMRRAAVSVPANLAEGCGRDSDPEIARYARIALGSASELEYYVLLAAELDYVTAEQHESLRSSVSEIKRMLASLANGLSPRSTTRLRETLITPLTTDDRRLTTDD